MAAAGKRRRAFVNARRILTVFVVTVIVLWLVSAAAVLVWSSRDEARPAQAIVVLGAAQYAGRPSPVLRARLDHALELWGRHLSPLLIRNGEVLPLDSNGLVVGAIPRAQYDESCLTMQSGDLLVCYTDGITEPENAYGEMFGEERLIELVKKHAHQDDGDIVRIVMDAVRAWTGTPELFDDMTLLLARQVTTVAAA